MLFASCTSNVSKCAGFTFGQGAKGAPVDIQQLNDAVIDGNAPEAKTLTGADGHGRDAGEAAEQTKQLIQALT